MEKWKEKKRVCVKLEHNTPAGRKVWGLAVDSPLSNIGEKKKKSSFKYMQVCITEAYLSVVVLIFPKADPETKCKYEGFIW